ncbi:uncharacterized protein LOC111270635 isoform X2 [Varroa jacobsoni]|uniref:uncharacterized protein LOC111270635 isoform X2 n=2 Tax=Varroa jacobsoni TaxID=62625 RepID=UPI000BF3E0BA|nr:uncharacterized protein LOC111270635 isoform X2 [Varroa jacobsoni]
MGGNARKNFMVRTTRYILVRLLKLLQNDYPVRDDISLQELTRILACHLYFRYARQSMFPVYDCCSTDPVSRGILIPEEEKRLEYPIPQAALEFGGPQELLLTGMRTSGELLMIRMVRAEQRRAQIHIVFKDSKNRTFVSSSCGRNANSEACRVLTLDISQGKTFQAGGLRLECMEPMRKWRIVFNDMLINKETGQAVHVRVGLLWFSMSHVMEWISMVPIKRLMDLCLEKGSTIDRISHTIASIETCRDQLNGYEQTGYYVGTFIIGGECTQPRTSTGASEQHKPVMLGASAEEQEICLRGNFMRIRHPQRLGINSPALNGFSHNFIFSIKGQMMQISTQQFAQSGRGLIYGSFVGTSGFKDPIEKVLNDQGLEADVQDVLLSPVLKCRTFELSHDLLRSEAVPLESFKSALGWNNELQVSTFDATIDDIKAIGMTIEGVVIEVGNDELVEPPLNLLDFEIPSVPAKYVIPLTDPQCKNCDLAGRKGSSLAVLTELSSMTNGRTRFMVPGGVVVTTEAFCRFLHSPKMSAVEKGLNKVLSTSAVSEVKRIIDSCKRRVEGEAMPSCISKQIFEQLQETFPNFLSKRFTVRSSCADEGLEDMCATSQMETFLGVKGEKEIIAAVLKCWASQLSFAAVEYKRRYGQKLLSKMAVLVMEMVPAECAGLILTCNPVTGDPSTIYIASKRESVVSELVDLDTVCVSRDINGNMTVDPVDVGKKDIMVVMGLDAGGTREEKFSTSPGAPPPSISPFRAAQLAHIGAEVERCYSDCLYIEWALQGDIVFLLQVRPVSFMDKLSDQEIALDMEIPSCNENACYSKVNIGKILDAAMTPLSTDMIKKECTIYVKKAKGKSLRERRSAVSPYVGALLKGSHHHVFFDLSETIRIFQVNSMDNRQMESVMLNLCGRALDNPEFHEIMNDKTDLPPHVPFFEAKNEVIRMKWLAKVIWRYNRYVYRKKARFPSPNMSAEELFNGFITALNMTIDYGIRQHLDAFYGSSLWISDIVNYLLSISNESTETICSNISELLGSAQDVRGCNAYKALENLSRVIQSEIGKDSFLDASEDDAIALLTDAKSYPLSSTAFQQYIDKHGHREHTQFDVYRQPRAFNAVPVVTTLQAIIQNVSGDSETKPVKGIWQAMQGLTCQLNFWQKLRLSYVVYFSRKSVGVCENTKSLWLSTIHGTRLWSWALARKLHAEGRLPEEELLFFCTINEIREIMETRDPAIIARAHYRKRLFPTFVELQFPEYFRGIPKPILSETPTFEGHVVQMKGLPINAGRIKARARVISKLENVYTVQQGEVLITYATDTSWSPYFPILGGIVTELGGFMSHGAVLARRYGLPCVVGLTGASKVFRLQYFRPETWCCWMGRKDI